MGHETLRAPFSPSHGVAGLAHGLLYAIGMEPGSGTLRIDRHDSPPHKTTFSLRGRLGRAELETVRSSIEPHVLSGSEIEVDLAELRFLDTSGANLLRSLRDRGASLVRATGYVREMLRAMEVE